MHFRNYRYIKILNERVVEYLKSKLTETSFAGATFIKKIVELFSLKQYFIQLIKMI